MFSEAIHSFADTSNQSLLMVGLKKSTKKPNEEFIYGYGRERFFWALISACGIFFIGAGVTTYRGVSALIYGKAVEYHPIVFVVLLLSFIIEFATLLFAYKELRKNQPEENFLYQLKNGDPSTLAVFYEDSVAVLGVIVAFASTILSTITKEHYWDAIGSIIIGVLLGIVAIVLIIKNRSFLIGRSIPPNLQEEIIEMLQADPAIERVIDFKSTTLDIGIYRIKCEIEFNGIALIKEIFQKDDLKEEYEEINNDYEQFKKFCVEYADRVPRLVGRKIDEIENNLKQRYKEVKYIDIEIN